MDPSDVRDRGSPFWAFNLALAATVLGTAGFAVVSIFGDEPLRVAVSDLGLFGAAAAAALASARAAASQRGPGRRLWVFMTLAMVSWAAGEGIWGFYELVLGREVPFPSIADVGYLAAIPFAALGMSAVLTRTTSRLRTLIDGLMIAGGLVFFTWVPLLGPIAGDSSATLTAKAVALAYPLGDVLLLSVVLFVLATTRGDRSQFIFLGVGVAAFAGADLVYGYLTLNDLYVSGATTDAGWLIGYLFVGLAAVRAWRPRASADARPDNFVIIQIIPYIGVALAAVLAIHQISTTGALPRGLIVIGSIMAFPIAVRQLLTVLENLSLTRDLESKVRDRTAELQTALAELKEAKRQQEEFVANTSHELRTPLTVIIGTMRTLMRMGKGTDPVAQDLLDRGNRAADRMSQLVEDLLTVAGLSDSSPLVPVPFDLTQELSSVIDGFDSPDKELVLTAAPDLIGMGDAAAFRLIVLHLLSNAHKFAPTGTRVTVDARNEDDHILVSVTDEGPGVPAEDRERAFERFVQLDGASTREHGGVGVGLFIARRLALRMGGDLRMVGDGPGTTLVTTIPCPVVPTTGRLIEDWPEGDETIPLRTNPYQPL